MLPGFLVNMLCALQELIFKLTFFLVYILWVCLYNSCAPFVHGALCFVLSVFRLFVYKPMRLTIPVRMLSCAYCCHSVFVPSLTSTRCKVETIAADRVPCICTGLTRWPFLLPLTPPPHSPPLDLWPLQQRLVGLSCQDKAGCAPSLLRGLCENLLLSFS